MREVIYDTTGTPLGIECDGATVWCGDNDQERYYLLALAREIELERAVYKIAV